MPAGAATPSVLRGPDAFAALADRYDDLARAVDAPLTARWEWLSTWARTHPGWRPLAVVVEDGIGDLRAAALLVHRRVGPLVDVAALGHGQSDYARFPARDAGAGRLLADATARAIRGLGPLRRLRLDGLPHADPVVARLVDVLGGGAVEVAEGAPWVPVSPDVDPTTTAGRQARTPVRVGRNRLATDGRTARTETTTDPDRIAALLPAVEGVHRARDEAARGRTELDDDADRAFWYAICEATATAGTLDLSVLRIDDDIAAYLLAFLDGPTVRVWDPRIAPAYARYNPGHLLRAEVLARVAADGRFTALDWMRGEERYKMATTSEVVPLDRVLAWSPSVLGTVEPHARRWLGRPR